MRAAGARSSSFWPSGRRFTGPVLRLRSIPKVRPRRRLPTKSSRRWGSAVASTSAPGLPTVRLDPTSLGCSLTAHAASPRCRCRWRLLFVGGVIAGAAVNWAVYALAWNRRPISPWSPPHPQAPPRAAARPHPRVGLVGPAPRGAQLHGRGFWVRPLAVELLMGAGLGGALLVGSRPAGAGGRAVRGARRRRSPPALAGARVDDAARRSLRTRCSSTLMAAASLIDIDEKTIPDGITVPGTLLGLVLATLLPMSLLPHVGDSHAAPPVGRRGRRCRAAMRRRRRRAVRRTDDARGAQRVAGRARRRTAVAGAWPSGWRATRSWCFALTPRIWRGAAGVVFGLRSAAGPRRARARAAAAGVDRAGRRRGDRRRLVSRRRRVGRPAHGAGRHDRRRRHGVGRAHRRLRGAAPRGDGLRRRDADDDGRRLPRLAGRRDHLLPRAVRGAGRRRRCSWCCAATT